MSKISNLPSTVSPSALHEFPASKDGITNKLSVQQVIDLANASIEDLPDTTAFFDPSDATKRVRIDAGNVTAGNTRVLTMTDADFNLADAVKRDELLAAPVAFPTLAAASGAVIPAAADRVGIQRYDAASPFDPLIYHEQASEPTHSLKFQTADLRWFAPKVAAIRVEQAGAIADASTNATPAYVRCREYLKTLITAGSLSAGIIVFGLGIFSVAIESGSVALSLSDVTNIGIEGASKHSTIIKLADGQGACHVISVANGVKTFIRHLTVDGNFANHADAGHGIRGENIDDQDIYNVRVQNCRSYGLGYQNGDIDNLRINQVEVDYTGADGMDIKSKGTGNIGLRIANVSVSNHGVVANDSPQAGIDIRGPAIVSNIEITKVGTQSAGLIGLRFRFGESSDTNGLGGHQSVVTGVRVIGTSTTNTVGINLGGRNISLSSAYVENVGTGVRSFEREATINAQAVSCLIGFDAVKNDVLTTNADYTSFNGCIARGCTTAGFILNTDGCSISGGSSSSCGIGVSVEATASHCSIVSHAVSGCTTGISIASGATTTSLIGNKLQSNTTSVSDSGTRTIAQYNLGWATEANLSSASLAMDSNGSRTAVINHGLAVTPELKDCSVFLIRETEVYDQVFSFFHVETVNATSVTVRTRVITASSTVGATFKMGVHIVTKNGP